MLELKKEQLEAINFDKGNILVSASAGSGKTFVMIERAIRLIIEKKADIKEILAVTFTESAAEEMKQKLRSALIDKIRETSSDELCRQLEEVSMADVSTLHSFCGRLIRQYFYVAGVSPDFKIIDEGQASKIKNQSLDQTFKEFYDACYIEKTEGNSSDLERVSDWFLDIVDIYSSKRTDKDIKEQILTIYDYVWSDARPFETLKLHEKAYLGDGPNEIRAQYKAILDKHLNIAVSKLKDILRFFPSAEYKKSNDFICGLIDDYENIISSDLYLVKIAVNNKRKLAFDSKLPSELSKKKSAVEKIKKFIENTLVRYDQVLISKESDDKDAFDLYMHTERICRLVRRFAQIYEQNKRDENALDFSDLEHFALKVLEDEKVQEAVRAKYKYVFIDEYQDVNGVQEEIVNKIANDNLFMVGDLKQSIYGFRGCRPDFFKQKFEKMQKENQKTVLLNHNFRSANAVIDMVNQIFSYSYNEDYSDLSYEKTSTLQSGGVYDGENRGRAKLHILKKEARKQKELERPRIYDILDSAVDEDEEISSLSSLLAEIIRDELKKTYYNPKTKEHVNVSYGDIALLSRRGSGDYVSKVVKGLIKYKIPVGSLVSDNACEYPEVISMIEALKLVDNFYQDVPLASTLKGPIGGFSDEDLADIAIFYRDADKYGTFSDAFRFYLENAHTKLKEKLAEFKKEFDDIRYIADFVGAFGVMKRLIERKNIYAFLLCQSDGKKKQTRLERFVSASIVEGKTLTVSEFLDKIKNSPEAFNFLEDTEEDAVKVMTIHASKGLEFPVTIVFGLEKLPNAKDDRLEIMLDRDYGLGVKNYDTHEKTSRESILRGLMRERNVISRMNEELRLFYVATTRAKYSMHLVANLTKDERDDDFVWAKKFIEYIPQSLECSFREPEEFDFTCQKAQTRKVLISKSSPELTREMLEKFDKKYEFISDTKLPLKSSVTGVLKKDEDAPPIKILFAEGETGTERGVIAHKILELYDFNEGKNLFDHANALVEQGILSKEQLDQVDLTRIEKGLSAIAKDILGKKTYPEKSFIANVPSKLLFDIDSNEQILVQGIIDLLAVDEFGLAHIVDYKYSTLSSEALKEKYHKQLEIYSHAVESVLGLKVKAQTLVNVFSGEVVKII